MTSLPLVRTEYMNTSTNTVRTGATSHGESLVDVESYLMRHDQIGFSSFHSWGVAEGLSVTGAPTPTSLTVMPGVAADSAGRLISLAVGGFAITDPTVDPTQVMNVPTVPVTADGVVVSSAGLTGDRYLTVTWREVVDPSSTGNAPTLIHAPWLRLQLAAEVPDTGEQVVLAHVILGDQSQVAALTAEHRRSAGIPAGRVELRRPRATAGPPATVDQLPAGELRATDGGGVALNLLASNGTVQPVLAADGNLALQPSSGSVGVGLHGTPPRRVLHVEGNEVHSGGPTGGFSFASRTTGAFVENPTAGERWTWYAADGGARLWSGADRLTIGSNAGGLRLSAGPAGASLELGAIGGGIGKLALTANTIVARRTDGTEPITVDAVNGRIGQGTATPSHALHVTANSGVRQNMLFLSGNTTWSSLSYNGYHNDSNSDWSYIDTNRPAVTLEMDDNPGQSRFNVYTTTRANTRAWQLRLGIDGDTGAVTIPGNFNVSSVAAFSSNGLSLAATGNSTASLSVTSASSGSAICTFSGNDVNAVQIFGRGNALFASGTQAATFSGAVSVTGTFTATDKRFVIDHPRDPKNRTLAHATVESDERAVVYSGNVTCGKDGRATVTLPDWVEALATDFRYQLTCVGGQAGVYIAEKLTDNAFAIAGGSAGLEVSWLVTGIRQDAWAKTHDLVVEADKPESERGFYQNPEAFGEDLTASVHWVRHEEVRKGHPVLAQRLVSHHAEQEATRLRARTERRAGAAKKRAGGK
ncbi:hypothetical protein [Actinophytocola sp.]|uniref:hypothetical protein n=1 Tax=Actinophytocola sp. TaxID=1872138 RepID=UPI002D5981CD|nr:hypothetical protein [Actinophytocola sp.]HYQ70239.1 hypothetical protein [Actinophytocola sp.]